MGRTVVSTTLAYTGGYIFLVLLAVCLATGASLSSLSFFLCSLKSLCNDDDDDDDEDFSTIRKATDDVNERTLFLAHDAFHRGPPHVL